MKKFCVPNSTSKPMILWFSTEIIERKKDYFCFEWDWNLFKVFPRLKILYTNDVTSDKLLHAYDTYNSNPCGYCYWSRRCTQNWLIFEFDSSAIAMMMMMTIIVLSRGIKMWHVQMWREFFFPHLYLPFHLKRTFIRDIQILHDVTTNSTQQSNTHAHT